MPRQPHLHPSIGRHRAASILIFVGLIVALVGLVACDDGIAQRASASSTPKEPSDVHVPRIATLVPFAADQLIELGARPVAVPALARSAPSKWAGIPTVAIDHSAGPNIEQLLASGPDVVVASTVFAQFMPMVEQSTGAQVVLMDVQSIEDVTEHIRTLGELSGRMDAAVARINQVEQQLAKAERISSPIEVLAIFGTPHSFFAFLPDSYLGDLVARAGGVMISGGLESRGVFRGLAPLSMEFVIDRDPDQLIVVFHGPEESARAMLHDDPLWSQLSAVGDGRVAFLKDDLYAMRPGSELPRAINEITAILEEARSRLHGDTDE
jgi:ABC-type Fe3+-hydroxamate transport system substrate-binding protein